MKYIIIANSSQISRLSPDWYPILIYKHHPNILLWQRAYSPTFISIFPNLISALYFILKFKNNKIINFKIKIIEESLKIVYSNNEIK